MPLNEGGGDRDDDFFFGKLDHRLLDYLPRSLREMEGHKLLGNSSTYSFPVRVGRVRLGFRGFQWSSGPSPIGSSPPWCSWGSFHTSWQKKPNSIGLNIRGSCPGEAALNQHYPSHSPIPCIEGKGRQKEL